MTFNCFDLEFGYAGKYDCVYLICDISFLKLFQQLIGSIFPVLLLDTFQSIQSLASSQDFGFFLRINVIPS